MTFKKLKTYSQMFNPQDAAEAYTFNTLPEQRGANPKKVESLSNKIKIGRVTEFRIAYAYVKGKDPEIHKILVNGQKSCLAIQKAKKPVEATITYYECDSEADFADVFTLYDTDEEMRSIDKSILIYRHSLGLKESKSITILTVKAMARIKGWNSDEDKSKRAELTKDCLKEIKFMGNMLDKAPTTDDKKMLFQIPIAQAILESWAINPKESEIFWKHVRDGAALSVGSPELVLRNFLMRANWQNGKMTYDAKEISIHTLHSKIRYAWKQFRCGTKKIKELVGNESTPLIEWVL